MKKRLFTDLSYEQDEAGNVSVLFRISQKKIIIIIILDLYFFKIY